MKKTITVPAISAWDEANQMFVDFPSVTLTFVHSLVSLSEWEARYHKPFVGMKMSREDLLSYIECMCITKNVDPAIFRCLPGNVLDELSKYIGDPMTATVITSMDEGPAGNKEGTFVTSELLYYYMFSYNIPKDCEKWHLNRLITLIRIFSEKNKPDKKMDHKKWMTKRNGINAARRARMHSKG